MAVLRVLEYYRVYSKTNHINFYLEMLRNTLKRLKIFLNAYFTGLFKNYLLIELEVRKLPLFITKLNKIISTHLVVQDP